MSGWLCDSCYTCGWNADRTSLRPPIEDIIQRYNEVAKAVNKREFERFTEELRKKWKPDPPEENLWEAGYRGQGWTDEGALAMCVFEQATGPSMMIEPDRHGSLCEAEKINQVLFRTMDQLLGDIRDGPPFDPQPEAKISETLAALKIGLQRQADTETGSSETIPVELANDFEQLLRVTDGLAGAGIPSETADTWLVSGISRLKPESNDPGERHFLGNWWRKHWIPYAAFELGGCTQHRQIYHVLCRDTHDSAAPISWKIMDRDDITLTVYDSLAEFLEHETFHIEKVPGGHIQGEILIYDSYPIHGWWEGHGGAKVENDSGD